MVWLLGLYSDAYASNQYRALQQFFKWLAEEEELPDAMARLHPPAVTEKLVPVFTSEELSKLEKACQGRSFVQRRDAAIIAVFTATGIRAAELAGIRYDAHDPQARGNGYYASAIRIELGLESDQPEIRADTATPLP
jgi:site-specific recombinase XerD